MSVVLGICLFYGSKLSCFFMYSISAVQKLQFNSMCLCMCKTDQLSLCSVLDGLKKKTESSSVHQDKMHFACQPSPN